MSKHLLRRTARARERRLEHQHPGRRYTVGRHYGRLYRWAVYEIKR